MKSLVLRAVPAAFLTGIAILLLRGLVNPLPSISFRQIQPLLADNRSAFAPLGEEFRAFSEVCPSAACSFIMDYPFHPYGKTVEQLYTAQSVLAPTLLNPQPLEPAALVYTSGSGIADKRLSETGYEAVTWLAPGKGLARRRP